MYSKTFMMTGDMTLKEEEDVLAKYKNDLKSDVLKVAHHGSQTSSCIEFLKAVSPKISIISVGYNNTYGLPNDEVLERVKGVSRVYMTMNSGNITVKVLKNSLRISTYR